MRHRTYQFTLTALIMLFTLMYECSAQDSDLHKALQEYITKSLGKGWVAIPHGADTRFRPKTMFVFQSDLQKKYEGRSVDKAWVPFSSGLSIYPEEYVPIQSEDVTLFTENAEGLSKLGLFASAKKLLTSVGLNASIKTEFSKQWTIKIEIEQAEREWVWQDEMKLAQEITERNAQRLTELLKKGNEGKVPPVQVVIGALRVRGMKAVVEKTQGSTVDASAELTTYLASLGLNWKSEKKRFESIVISDWKYIAFQGLRAQDGQCTISSSGAKPADGSEVYAPPGDYVP